jgi:hypothetical protein
MAVDVVAVDDAPHRIPDSTELVVVGAPTHDLGMSTPETRQAARARTGQASPSTGVREWLAEVAPGADPPLLALFDTRIGYPWLAGSAAAQASALASGRGWPVMPARETFRVQDIAGPLLAGEDDRARRWASVVAARLDRRRPTGHRASGQGGGRAG